VPTGNRPSHRVSIGSAENSSIARRDEFSDLAAPEPVASSKPGGSPGFPMRRDGRAQDSGTSRMQVIAQSSSFDQLSATTLLVVRASLRYVARESAKKDEEIAMK
jgi:hypothetical protein